MPNYSPVYTFSGAGLSAAVNGLDGKVAEFYTNETDFSGLPEFLQPAANQAGSTFSAAISLIQWLDINKTGYSGPGLTAQDPFVVPVDQSNRQEVIETLGTNADVSELKSKYESTTRFHPSVRNVFFNFAPDPHGGIRWDKERNELIYFDRYNFEGFGDFGLSPPSASMNPVLKILYLVASGTIGLAAGVAISPTALIRQIMVDQGFNPNTGEFADGTPISEYGAPFTVWKRGDRQISFMRNLFIELRFPASEICKHNPGLYRDAVSKGYLEADATADGSCSNISQQAECLNGADNVVPVGQAQPMPLLGFPYYTPRVMVIGSSPSSWNVGTNDKYPSPFTSFQQQITNNTHFLGPYAMWGPIAGRICLIVGGVNSGQKGFIAQCWDDFDDGNYNVDADGIQYSSKKDWWDNTRKIEVTVPNLLFSERPMTPVKVAVESFDGPGAENVWGPNYPISSSPFGSVNLSYLIPLVAITGRYF